MCFSYFSDVIDVNGAPCFFVVFVRFETFFCRCLSIKFNKKKLEVTSTFYWICSDSADYPKNT